MIKLYQNDKIKDQRPEPVEVNFSLSINIGIDMRESLTDWLRDEKYKKSEGNSSDNSYDEAEEYAKEKCKNITDKDLAKFIEQTYSYKGDIIDMIILECPENDIDISVSMSRPLSSIVKND